ncbi:MAG TPA: hypothetical protein PKM13_07545 [Candidatus Bipolaricaulis anaerobius]|nr:hypothetical protein [Candidatus Bipolaricaulis anaerobius]
MRPAFTLLLYSFRSMTRYRSEFYGSLTTPLFLALPAVLLGYWGEQLGLLEAFAQATGTARYLVYILLGAVYWNYVEAVWSIAFSLRGAMRSGVLEALLVTGLSRLGMIGGWSGARLLGVTVHSALAVPSASPAGATSGANASSSGKPGSSSTVVVAELASVASRSGVRNPSGSWTSSVVSSA